MVRKNAMLYIGTEYTLEARPNNKHKNADDMRYLPLKVTLRDTPQLPEFVLLLDTLSGAPVTCSQVQRLTRQDRVLASVLTYTQLGWSTVPRAIDNIYFHTTTQL